MKWVKQIFLMALLNRWLVIKSTIRLCKSGVFFFDTRYIHENTILIGIHQVRCRHSWVYVTGTYTDFYLAKDIIRQHSSKLFIECFLPRQKRRNIDEAAIYMMVKVMCAISMTLLLKHKKKRYHQLY